jgi:hypothetical protein
MRKRRKFNSEFKEMVVELNHHHEDIMKLPSELDMHADLIY